MRLTIIRLYFTFIILLGLAHALSAQNNDFLLRVGDETVDIAEYKHIYQKNNTNLYDKSDKKSPTDYLDLFIDFKLKVAEAKSLKMDTSQTFINELSGYREQIAVPYLSDVQYEDKLVHELYERMKLEVNASHILLRLDKNALPAKTTEVLNKIISIRKELLNGKDFEKAAVEYSEDPSAQNNKGKLGYFSAFRMVAPFENAAFNTAVGEISEPVRTEFGYHLIKVNEVRENQGEIQVAHIMKGIPKNASTEQKAEVKAAIDAIYTQLENGADFAELARQESQDKRSAVNEGKMPWFGAGKIVPEFSEASFRIKNIGDYTTPVETDFGYHIIKKLDERTVPPFEEAKIKIETEIRKDAGRSNSSQKEFIDKLKQEYSFSENSEAKQQLISLNLHDSIPELDATVFTIDNKNYSTNDLKVFVDQMELTNGTYVSIYERWVNSEVINYEDSKLEEKYPEFRYLMNEYYDGILLFNISQEKIWNFATEDSIGLQTFYQKNKNLHQWGERFEGSVITCDNVETREEVENLFGAGMLAEEVVQHLNEDKEHVKINTGAWEEGTNETVDYYVWNGKEPESFDSSTTFIRGGLIKPEPKHLDEARGLYISDYQNYLEKKWLKELRGKHKVKVNKKLLKTVEGV